MKITKHLKNLEIDERLIMDIPNEVAEFLGEDGIQRIRTDERHEVGKRINCKPHTNSTLRFFKGNGKEIPIKEKAIDRDASEKPVFFFQLISNGNKDTRHSVVYFLRDLRIGTTGDLPAKPGIGNRRRRNYGTNQIRHKIPPYLSRNALGRLPGLVTRH